MAVKVSDVQTHTEPVGPARARSRLVPCRSIGLRIDGRGRPGPRARYPIVVSTQSALQCSMNLSIDIQFVVR